MSEEPLTYGELPPLVAPVMPTALIWATSTDLPGTDKERKQYFIQITDGDKTIRVILAVHADRMIQVEPYVAHEYGYTQYDDWDEDGDPYDEMDVSDDEEDEDEPEQEGA